MTKYLTFSALFALLMLSAAAHAANYVITLQQHRFTPSVLTIPAGHKVQITIKNLDANKVLFYSYDLNRKKVIDPHGDIRIFIGPLGAGSYRYCDRFHLDTAKGIITAK